MSFQYFNYPCFLSMQVTKCKSLKTTLGGRFNFVCTGVCDHTIGKLTHPQTEAGLSINKNRPIPRLRIMMHVGDIMSTVG